MLQLSSSLEKNLAALNARFGASADFYAKRIELYHCPGAIVLFDNMASLESLWSLLLDAATRHTPSLEPERVPHTGTQVYDLLMNHSGLPAEDGPVKDMDDLIRRMTAGMAVLLLDGCKKGLVFSVQGLKSRSVEEPSGEGNLRGSREGFADLLLCTEDDVSGNHASSAGQLDMNTIYFLMTRGFSLEDARLIVVEALIRPLIDRLDESVREEVLAEVRRKLDTKEK